MIPATQIQEELSRAYIYAIAASVGYTYNRPQVDYDSNDIVISCPGKPELDSLISSPSLEIQVKASTSMEFENGILKFPLPIKNYNDLRANTLCPRILIVYVMPKIQNDWVSHNTEQLALKKCAYWLSLFGLPETENKTSKIVDIPEANIFDGVALQDIMKKIAKGVSLANNI